MDSDDSTDVTLGTRSLVDFKWERRVSRGLQFNINGTHMGRDYRPELGFLQRTRLHDREHRRQLLHLHRQPQWLRRYYPGALAFSTFRNSDGVLESGQYAFWVEWDTKAGGNGWIEPKWFKEDVTEAVLDRERDGPGGRLRLRRPADRPVDGSRQQAAHGTWTSERASYFDGTRAQVILTPTWNVSPHLELGTDYQLSHLEFDKRDQVENVQLARFRIRAALNAAGVGERVRAVQLDDGPSRLQRAAALRFRRGNGPLARVQRGAGHGSGQRHDRRSIPYFFGAHCSLKYTHTLGF